MQLRSGRSTRYRTVEGAIEEVSRSRKASLVRDVRSPQVHLPAEVSVCSESRASEVASEDMGSFWSGPAESDVEASRAASDAAERTWRLSNLLRNESRRESVQEASSHSPAPVFPFGDQRRLREQRRASLSFRRWSENMAENGRAGTRGPRGCSLKAKIGVFLSGVVISLVLIGVIIGFLCGVGSSPSKGPGAAVVESSTRFVIAAERHHRNEWATGDSSTKIESGQDSKVGTGVVGAKQLALDGYVCRAVLKRLVCYSASGRVCVWYFARDEPKNRRPHS